MKSVYQVQSKRTGVPWNGRTYKPNNLAASDPVNSALTMANSLMYALCHASIVSMGLSPGLGFIHTGNALSFVYDVADLYKAETTIPAAFEATGIFMRKGGNLSEITRRLCRKYFLEKQVLKSIAKDISAILGIDSEEGMERDSSINNLWLEEFQVIKGSVNYGNDLEEEEDDEW